MKKFHITKFYFNLFVALFVIFLFLTFFYTKILSEDGLTFNDCIIIVVHAFGAIWMLKALIFTFSSGKVSVDRSGCIMYIGWKKYCYAWDDLPCCGMADVDVGSVGNAVDTYWVYLSSRNLSVNERRRFIQNTNRYVKTMVFFQYDPELFDLVLQYAPEPLRAQLEQLSRPQKWKRSPLALAQALTAPSLHIKTGAGVHHAPAPVFKKERLYRKNCFPMVLS